MYRDRQEASSRGLASRARIGSLYRDLAKRPTSFRDLAQRSYHETSYRVLAQRLGEESKGLARRSFIDSLNSDLSLRSLTKIFCGDLL